MAADRESPRERLVEAAARLLVEEGPGALTARRLARELGTSTMALYTHFGGMEQLRVEVRKSAFARLAAHLEGVAQSDDPVADLALQGFAYCENATTGPDLYRAAFLEAPLGEDDGRAAQAAFEPLVATVRRCVEAGRFDPPDPLAAALQVWTATHGVASAHVAGILRFETAIDVIASLARTFAVGLGDDPARAERSVARARERSAR